MAGLILAAGLATRMTGVVKPLLDLHGAPFIAHVLRAAVAAGLDPLVVVAGRAAASIERAASELDIPSRTVVNPAPESGIAGSIRLGAEALASAPPATRALAVLLGDEPGVRPDAIRRVLTGWRDSRAEIARARYSDRPGHPVVVGRAAWGRLGALRGDQGLAVSGRAEAALEIPIPYPAPVDVDTEAAYREVLARLRHTDP